jgi:NADH-quinone oxidoreductase subunit H
LADVDAGVLFILAMTSLGAYGVLAAGWASNSRYAFLGAMRAAAQIISYEIAMGFALVGVLMAAGSMNLSTIVEHQKGGVLSWYILPLFPLFFVYWVSAVAETNRAPFDIAEGESEIVAGYFLEYSGMRWSAFMLAEYVALVGVASLITTLFFGGYHVPWLHLWESAPQWIVTILQVIKFSIFTVFFCWFQIQLRWTVPKFRFDQTMALGWKKLLPLSLANVFVTAFVILAFG